MVKYLSSLLFVILMASIGLGRPPTPVRTIEDATSVLTDLGKIPLKGIPPKLLEDAKAVAIIPGTIKVGFVVGGRMGHGLVLTKNEKGEWSDPTFITLGGASVGFQAGVQSTDVVLVFKKRESLEKVLSGKDKLTLGADASIAAGPVGREAGAATDGKLHAEIFSYSRGRGLFAGVSFNGAAIMHDRDNNEMFKADQRAGTAKAVAKLKAELMVLGKELPPATNPRKR
ncbi:MAG TPA: lipid-binding SYLF domain-containing protein [Fimbriiglobus sp.]|jgi:lipid-binding SYLF domain-containing protein